MQKCLNNHLQSPSGRPFSADLYYKEDGFAKPLVIFLHGFKGFKDWGCWNLVAAEFVRNGFVFVKFNFSHNGVSEKDPFSFTDLEAFGRNTFSMELADLGVVINWLSAGHAPIPAEEINKECIFLVGHSRGGGLAILKAAQDNRIKAVSTWAGVSNLAFLWEGNPMLEKWIKEGVIYVQNARTGQDMPVYISLYEDYMNHQPFLNVEYSIKKLKKPCLVVHGESDTSVNVEAARLLCQWNPEAELFIIPGADHVFGGRHPWAEPKLPPEMLAACEKTISFFHANMQKVFLVG